MLNRLRLGRFLSMDLAIQGERKYTDQENKQILLQMIEMGSLQGIPEMSDLIQSGYIIRAEYDIQLGPLKGMLL